MKNILLVLLLVLSSCVTPRTEYATFKRGDCVLLYNDLKGVVVNTDVTTLLVRYEVAWSGRLETIVVAREELRPCP